MKNTTTNELNPEDSKEGSKLKKGYKNNLNFEDSKEFERQMFKRDKPLLQKLLKAKKLYSTDGSDLDIMAGIDFTYVSRSSETYGEQIGVSLRHRNKDYNAFTVKLANSQGAKGQPTEWEKWCFDRLEDLKPHYHIQISPNGISEDELKVWIIDIDKFVEFTGMSDYSYAELKQTEYYKDHLEALEFKKPKDSDSTNTGIYQKIWTTNKT